MTVATSIRTKLTPNSRYQLTSLTHAYWKENSARIYIQISESDARKRQREEEEQQTRKRLKKVDTDQC